MGMPGKSRVLLSRPGLCSQVAWALMEIHLLQAVALHELAKTMAKGTAALSGSSLNYLTRSLALGLPKGYARVYLQEGQGMVEMLQVWLRSNQPDEAPAGLKPLTVKHLLAQFGPEPLNETNCQNSALHDRWQAWFDGMTVTRLDCGETIIEGLIQDQSELVGVFNQIYSLNLTLFSINCNLF